MPLCVQGRGVAAAALLIVIRYDLCPACTVSAVCSGVVPHDHVFVSFVFKHETIRPRIQTNKATLINS